MKRAFTLIELLVVIAIIAILAAILFPVFAQAKVAAKKTTDLSNQKQIGTGIMLYINDSDDVYPMAQYNASTDPTQWVGKNWQTMVDPYVKSGRSFVTTAPTAVGQRFNTGSEGLFGAPEFIKPKQDNGGYAIRMDFAPDGIAPWSNANYQPKTQSSSAVNAPADKIYVIHRGANATQGNGADWNWVQWDANEWAWHDWLGMNTEEGTPTNPNIQHHSVAANRGDCDNMQNATPVWDTHTCGRYPRYRYNGSSNFTFFDGHAKSYRRSANGHQINYARNIFVTGVTNDGAAIY